MKVNKPNKKLMRTKSILAYVGLILTTLVVFYPSLANQFTDWDDQMYFIGNRQIISFSFSHIKEIFSSFFNGNYHPLAILSSCVDYSLGGLNPKMFHGLNLVLHIVNVILVYRFIYFLTSGFEIAVITSLLFAVHPMHVESVAWASERKDVLYSLFFISGLCVYLLYVKSAQNRYFYFTLLLFLLSCLSKAQAVVLTPILILIDYYLNRKFTKNTLFEKIPFLLLSLIFGILAIIAQGKSVNEINIPFGQAILLGCDGLLTYLSRAFIPLHLSAFYPYSGKGNYWVSFINYLVPLGCLIIAFLIYRFGKKDRLIIFGSLFFVITIFPVLEFLPVGRSMTPDRYSYIPYMGIFLVIAHLIRLTHERKAFFMKYLYRVIVVISPFLIGVLIYLTQQRIKVWYDSISLWTDVLEKYPDCQEALDKRIWANIHLLKNNDAALIDINKKLEIDSADYNTLYNRAVLYQEKGDLKGAVSDYKRVIKYEPSYVSPYENLSLIYIDKLNMLSQGRQVCLEGLKIDSNNLHMNQNYAVANYKSGNYGEAIKYYNRALNISPNNGHIYLLRSLCYATGELHRYKEALMDAMKASEFGERVDEDYIRQLKEAIKIQTGDNV
jgi:tetratricopeptide (TPR) repeat protein